MYTSQPTVRGRRPIGMPEPRLFGVEDRPSCPSCTAEMHLFRRSPEPGHNSYEVQIFSCMKCDAEITRSVDRKGKPHTGRLGANSCAHQGPRCRHRALDDKSVSIGGNSLAVFGGNSLAV
jgi:hypothetical protein